MGEEPVFGDEDDEDDTDDAEEPSLDLLLTEGRDFRLMLVFGVCCPELGCNLCFGWERTGVSGLRIGGGPVMLHCS